MQEHDEDAYGRNKADGEEPDRIETCPQRAPVGKLVLDNAIRHHPANEDAGEERAERQKNIGGQIVTALQEGSSEKADVRRTTRQRAEHTDGHTHQCLHDGSLLTRDMQLLIEHCCTDLVHGNGRSQCRQGQERIEQYADDIPEYGAEGLLKDIGQRDEDE